MPVKENAPSHSENKLHVLILEDIPSDAELAQRELKKTLQNYTVEVVDTREGFVQALETFKPDLIISDFMLPTFDGLSALKIKLDIAPMTPFVMLTGSMNEETAVECLQAGADDYVIKEHIKRLGPATLNALEKKINERQRKRAEAELRDSEIRYRNIVQNANEGFSIVDEFGKIIEWNHALEKITGLHSKEVLGKDMWVIQYLMEPDDSKNDENSEQFERTIKSLLKTGKAPFLNVPMEREYTKPDGSAIQVRGTVSSVETEKGFLIFSRVEDITEQSQTQKKYRDLVDKAGIAIVSDDINGNFTYFNQHFTEIFGYSSEELKKESIKRLVHPDDVEEVLRHHHSRFSQKSTPPRYEFRGIRKDGTIIYLEIDVTLLFEGEACIGTQSYIWDISNRKQAEKNLEKSEAYLKSVMQTVQVGIGVVIDKKIIHVNQHSCDMLGYTSEELLGQNAQMVYPSIKEYERVDKDRYEQIKNTGSGTIDTRFLHKDGHIIDVLLSSTAIDIHDLSKGVTFSAVDITQRNLANEEIKKLSTAVIQSPTAIAITDLEGNIEYVNPRFNELTGYSSAEVMGKNPRILNSGKYSKTYYKNLWNTISSGNKWSGELINKNKGGDLYWEAASIAPIFDAAGKKSSYIKFAEDITERKLAEGALIDSQQNFRLLADHTGDWECLIGADHQYLYHSPACERITGYTEEELLNDPDLLLKMTRPDYQSIVSDHHRLENIPNTPNCRLEFPFLHKDGTERWLEHHCSPVSDSNGKYSGRRGSNRDITKRKLAQKTLMESEEKYRLIVENANDGIEITQDDKVLYTNKRFAEMLGYTVKTIKNIFFSEFFTEEGIKDLYERQKKRKRNNLPNFSYESTFYKKDGSIIDVEIKAEIIDYKGKPATFAIVRDITEHKQADEEIGRALLEAKQANAVKDQFIANISHEIRTPLNSILGFSDILGNRFGDRASEADKKIFTYINSAGNRLMRTVDAILNMSQLQAGLVRLHPQKLNLSKLVLAVIKDLKPAADEKQLEFRYKSPPQPVLVFVDEYSIQQVLLNLIENAIKYTKEGSVELKQDLKDDQVVLSVIDTGAGIPAEHQQRIFEPYTQESEGYTKAYQGVGLGLAITKKYLELNNVKLGLFSQPDIGSTFTLTFSIVKEQAHV